MTPASASDNAAAQSNSAVIGIVRDACIGFALRQPRLDGQESNRGSAACNEILLEQRRYIPVLVARRACAAAIAQALRSTDPSTSHAPAREAANVGRTRKPPGRPGRRRP